MLLRLRFIKVVFTSEAVELQPWNIDRTKRFGIFQISDRDRGYDCHWKKHDLITTWFWISTGLKMFFIFANVLPTFFFNDNGQCFIPLNHIKEKVSCIFMSWTQVCCKFCFWSTTNFSFFEACLCLLASIPPCMKFVFQVYFVDAHSS